LAAGGAGWGGGAGDDSVGGESVAEKSAREKSRSRAGAARDERGERGDGSPSPIYCSGATSVR